MTEAIKVLIVDDDRTWQAFLEAALQEKYLIKIASNGTEAEQLAVHWQPDAVLLDIEMPGKNGYDVCKTLKNTTTTKDIPVIFLSASSSLQEKIAGFELGGDDYLVKPCEAEYLQAKVAHSAALYREKQELGARANSAQHLAFEAMNSSADLGRSLRFAERTYAMGSFDQLAEGLFQTMEEFGLESSVMFVTPNGPLFYTDNQRDMSPLEQDMFVAVHQEGRFCDFGRRTFCNFKQISLLIKNMPMDAPERYGRIKDAVPGILGAADGKVGALNLHNTLAQQHGQVAASIETLSSKLNAFAEGFTRSNQIIAGGAAGLYRIAQQASGEGASIAYQQLLDQLAHNNQLGAELEGVLTMLARLAEEQRHVNQIIMRNGLSDTATELATGEIYSSGVDFF